MAGIIGSVGLTFIAVACWLGQILERGVYTKKREAFVAVDERLAIRDGAR
jgi:uncharacterized membrane protein YGL010W